MQSLAATTLAQGGDRQSSRVMWEAILQSSEISWQRQDAERRLLQLQALDLIDTLQRIVDEYARRAGAPATDWAPIIREQSWPGTPADPSRTPFVLTNGRVTVAQSSPLWPMPAEPQRADGRLPS
jgi:hypothetical protein